MIGRWERQEMDYQVGEAYVAIVKARRGPQEWTTEECRAFDGLLFGYEQELAYWDDIAREAINYCTVCDGMFHQQDLEPCGPSDAACPACREAWENIMQDEASEDSNVSA